MHLFMFVFCKLVCFPELLQLVPCLSTVNHLDLFGPDFTGNLPKVLVA